MLDFNLRFRSVTQNNKDDGYCIRQQLIFWKGLVSGIQGVFARRVAQVDHRAHCRTLYLVAAAQKFHRRTYLVRYR